jgi:hypothetical protein
VWTISGPAPTRPGDVQTRLHCRIAGAAMTCFDRKNTQLAVDGENLRIGWFPTLAASNVIEARMTAPDTFRGTERARMLGIAIVAMPREGRRQTPDPAAPDLGGKAALLRSILHQLADGNLTLPHAGPQIELPDAASLRSLGGVQAISYLDRANTVQDDRLVADFFTLYDVRFERGERFCGLHSREDGVLDGLRCV